MQDYYTSKKYLIKSIIQFIVFNCIAILLIEYNFAVEETGVILFYIFASYFFIVSIPSFYRIIYILIKPRKIISIYHDAIIIYTRKKNIEIDAKLLYGYKKNPNSLLRSYIPTHGNITLLIKYKNKPYIIKFVERIDDLAESLDIIISNNTKTFK